jgi:hypothetical protein
LSLADGDDLRHAVRRMESIDPQLRRLIEHAADQGIGMDDIEHDLIDPANLPREEHDALWLYALGRRDAPGHISVPLVHG